MIDEEQLLEQFGPSADIENALYGWAERRIWRRGIRDAAFVAALRGCKDRLARDWIEALRPYGLSARLWFGFKLVLWSLMPPRGR